MSSEWLREVDAALAARAAGVLLTFNTADRIHLPDEGIVPCSLPRALAQRFSALGYHIGYFSLANGMRRFDPPGSESGVDPFRGVTEAQDAAALFAEMTAVLQREDPPVLLLVDYIEHVTPAVEGSLAGLDERQLATLEMIHGWGRNDNLKATRNFVVLISYEDSVSRLLADGAGFRTVRVNLPDLDTRNRFAECLSNARSSGSRIPLGELAADLDLAEFARISNGLRLLDIEELLRESGRTQRPVDREMVRRVKRQAISQLGRDQVEIIEPHQGFEAVAGAHHAKDYFELIRWPWAEGAPGVPQAILLAGVPGCGKSHLVKALARELSAPLLVMRNLHEKWVGASERNLERVLRIAESLSPCVLWTDEVDQAIGQRSTGASGDSGTSERMLARIFEFFGSMEHRGRILWIATTNRPDILDPALLDRFQVVLPFVHPTAAERAELLPILAQQIGRELGECVAIPEVCELPEMDALTVRSMQEILVYAGLRSDRAAGELGSKIAREGLLDAVRDYKPSYNPVEHQFIALTALEMTPFTTLLPWMGQAGFGGSVGFPEYLSDLVDAQTGELNAEALQEKLRTLRERRFAEHARR